MSDGVKWTKTMAEVNEGILVNLRKPHPSYYVALATAFTFVVVGVIAWANMIAQGMGKSGLNSPVYWGVLITDFVFWVGIGHAGTLISAILFLFRAKWRNSVNRFAEAMTIFAVITAALFPLIHVGRVWLALYWMLPLPNSNNLWVNFKSPLVWDVFAISTYLTVSLLFWYMGLIPDLASIRDRLNKGFKRLIYGFLSFGWRGSVKQWHHYEA
ncbi:MAG: polysulfide reductase NrfD, partial [Oligoflexales bacterium]|nr:polysulfide reductase NrfD [Oligoflexales bacterium]